MEMTGEQRISAPRERVWAALNDTEILRQCIPGCETLEKLSDTEMRATARIKVGPISAQFAGAVTLSDIDPPNGYRITGEGQGGVAGFARGEALVNLEAEGNETILHYTVKAQVGGKLAQLGGRLIDVTARQMAAAFFSKFAAALAPEGLTPETQAPDTGAVAPKAASAATRTPPPPTSNRPGWLAPAIAIAALALLAVELFTSNGSNALVMNDRGAIILTLVALAAAVGYLFGQRSR